jgi:hypothetical protein
MHTIHFYTLHSMSTRLLRTVVKHQVAPHTVSPVYLQFAVSCPTLSRLSLDVLASLRHVYKPSVLLTDLRKG